MFPKILYLTLSLPIIILAHPLSPHLDVVPRDQSLKPVNASMLVSAPTGDTLNRTVCFCASPDWRTDRNYGYYYNISYYNAHLDRTFPIERTCHSSNSINIKDRYDPKGKPVLQNQCLRSRFHDELKWCTPKDDDGNKFCYTLAGGPDYDIYSFNGQQRDGLPLEPEINYSKAVVEEVCEASCKEQVGGMEMLKGDALEVLAPYYKLVGERLDSSVVFYPSIPDMCEGCK